MEKHENNVQELDEHSKKIIDIEKNNNIIRENQFIEHIKSIRSDNELQIESLKNEIQNMNDKIKELQDEIIYYKENLLILQEKKFEIFSLVSKIIKKYTNKQEDFCEKSIDYDEETKKNLYFLEITIDKLLVENNWLADQLKSFTKDNEKLKKTIRDSTKVSASKDLSESVMIFNDFERSRVRLSRHLSDKNVELSKTYSQLSNKYL